MTQFSLEKLLDFLNRYQGEFHENIRVADYGGAYFTKVMEGALASGGIHDYTALDYETGVDLNKPIKGKKFSLGVCMDLLEHCDKPWIVAKNITDSLLPKSLLFVTAPFTWEVHAYPNDYFRFTLEGISSLFEEMQLLEGGIFRDKQGKKEDGGCSRTSDKDLPRTRVVAIYRKK